MSSLLNNKRIVVIGGTSGLGLSAVKAFREQGARVVAVGKDSAKIEEAKKQVGKNVEFLIGDAVIENTASDAITYCLQKFQGFDGLYHVAGGSGRKFGDGPLHELTLEGWNKTFEINLTSLMFSNQAAVKQFLIQKTGGTILNMASVLAYSPSPEFFSTHAYAAAKSAVVGFSKSVASYYAKNDIRVNVIAPALIETPMAKRAAGDENILSFIKKKQPLDGGRIGLPEDVDGIAIYFMSDYSKFTTGQLIAVDGGWSISEGK